MLSRSKASKLPKTLDHVEFESAIKDKNEKKIKELISKGHKLCSTCWSFLTLPSNNIELVKLLTKHDNSFINQPIKIFRKSCALTISSYPTVLMVFCYRGMNYNDMKFFIDQGADVNALNADGQNVLFYVLKNGSKFDKLLFRNLIEAGANPHVRDNTGHTLLHWVVNNIEDYDVYLLKFLVEEIGIDPLVKSNDNTSVLASAIGRYFRALNYTENQHHKLVKIRFEAMRYLFDLPQIQNAGSNDPSSQIALLSNLHMSQEISEFDFFFTNQFMNGELIERDAQIRYSSTGHTYQHNFGPVGIFLKNVFSVSSSKINHFLDKISSIGISINDPPNCFSPLFILLQNRNEFKLASVRIVTTARITTRKDHDQMNNCESFQVVKKFVESGAYVGLRIIQQQYDNCPELAQLAEEILLPDVFFALSFHRRNGRNTCPLLILRYLLPHLAAPPLALALVNNSYSFRDKMLMLAILFEFGPVPPGTRLLAMLRRHFETLADECSYEHFCQVFEEMHSSPPSLMHLCRSQIRMTLAAQMPRDLSGPNLPELIATFTKIPPPLRVYLQMWPQEPMNVVVCDNQRVVDIVNRPTVISRWR